MSSEAIERIAGEVAVFYELPTTPNGVARTFVDVFRLILRLLKCPPEVAFGVTANCFPDEYRAFICAVARGERVAVELPYGDRFQIKFPELN